MIDYRHRRVGLVRLFFFLGFREQDICRDASASTEVIIGRDIDVLFKMLLIGGLIK
jgi:hypothetical protein